MRDHRTTQQHRLRTGRRCLKPYRAYLPFNRLQPPVSTLRSADITLAHSSIQGCRQPSNFLSVELQCPLCWLPLGIGYCHLNQTDSKRTDAITCPSACLTKEYPGECAGRLIQQVD